MSLPLLGAGPGGTSWTPAVLANVTAGWDVATARSLGKIWQDAGKTTPAVANNDPVQVVSSLWGAALDYSAGAASTRPLLQTDGVGHWWLLFDGVNDLLSAALTLTQGCACWATVNRVSGTAGQPLDSTSRLLMSGSSANYQLYAGTTILTAAGLANGVDHVWGGVWNGASSFLYVDGTQKITGNPGAAGTGGTVIIGNDGSAQFSNQKVYGLVPVAGVPSAADRANLDAYMAALHP